MPTDFWKPFMPGQTFHVFNRGNDRGLLFYNQEHYGDFLARVWRKLHAYVDLYAFALLPNHFHLLLRVKPEEQILLASSLDYKPTSRACHEAANAVVSRRFRELFLGFAKHVNATTEREGSLFRERVRRLEIDSETYLLEALRYINRNGWKHGVVENFEDYGYTSYNALVRGDSALLARDEVVSWFGSVEAFAEFHQADSPTPRHVEVLTKAPTVVN
ncbi:MAG: hypothetical protein AAF752_12600 [Bacteroidota bacterium]